MFYCDACRKKNKWPEGFSGSYGKCEMCGEVAVCHDVPSSALPSLADNQSPRVDPKVADLVHRLGWVYINATEYKTFMPKMQQLCSEVDDLSLLQLDQVYQLFVETMMREEGSDQDYDVPESIEAFWMVWVLPLPRRLRIERRASIIAALPIAIDEQLKEGRE